MPRRSKKRLFFGCVGLPLLVCGIGGGLVCSKVSAISSKLPDEVAKLKKLGVATEVADLAPNPPVSDAHNAASLYGSIGYQLEAIQGDKAQSDLVKLLDTFGNSRNPDPDLGKVLQAIQTHQSLFSDADKLATKPHADFKRDYTKGLMVEYPEFADMKRIVKWQASRARAQWMTGNRTAALEALKATYRIAEHAAQEPNLLGQLVCIAISAICHRTIESFMTEARNDPVVLKKIEAMLVSQRDRADMRKAFGGEVVLGRAMLQNSKKGFFDTIAQSDDSSDKSYAWLDTLLSNRGMRKMYEAKFCEAWRITFDQLPQDKEDWAGFHDAVDRRNIEIDADRSIENILNRIMFPILPQAIDAAAKQVAERRIELLSLKLLQTRHKGLPSNLAAFGKLGIDPFTGKSMGYKRDGKAFKIWSVGPDRIDQGGIGRSPGGEGYNGIDIVMGSI